MHVGGRGLSLQTKNPTVMMGLLAGLQSGMLHGGYRARPRHGQIIYPPIRMCQYHPIASCCNRPDSQGRITTACASVRRDSGIGTETTQRPVVIVGRVPHKAMAASWLPSGNALCEVSSVSTGDASAYSPLRKSPKQQQLRSIGIEHLNS